MQCRAVEMIGEKGAARAAFAPIRTEHEVIDDQLAASVEEIAENLLPRRRVEDIVLFEFDPGQCAPLSAELIAGLGERLLVCEMRLPRRDPFVAGYDLVLHDQTPLGEARRARLPAPRET